MFTGFFATIPTLLGCPSTGKQTYSEYAPNRNPVNAKTASPLSNCLTSAPAASITPASSIPSTGRLGRENPNMFRANTQGNMERPAPVRNVT